MALKAVEWDEVAVEEVITTAMKAGDGSLVSWSGPLRVVNRLARGDLLVVPPSIPRSRWAREAFTLSRESLREWGQVLARYVEGEEAER